MTVPSEITGVHQSDVIIRSAIISALDDLRANPWLLDHAFASLPKDTLTKPEYGQREVDRAKKWFMSTRIPVLMSHQINEPTLPCITISLIESAEAETTLSDTHYVPAQDDSRVWPDLSARFTPISFYQASGYLTVPDAIGDALVLAPGMQIVDGQGRSHEVLEIIDIYTVMIAENTNADFRNSVIRGQRPSGIMQIESVRMKEVYAVGTHAQAEQTHLTYLHTLLVFCLYRYKMRFLEARGFERSVVSSSDFRRNEAFENELVWSRHINISGYVSHVWPGDSTQKITNLDTIIRVDESRHLPPDTDPDDHLWIGDEDSLTFRG